MGKFKDLTGKSFGMWKVIRRDGHIGCKVAFLCQCECGTERKVNSSDLKTGKTKSCGCAYKNDLTGKTYGKLRVVERVPNSDSGAVRYRCECDCGNDHTVQQGNLVAGTVSHCGCSMGNVLDLTGRVFGRLIVKERAKNSDGGRVQWLCECECGESAIVISSTLLEGDTKSCGCLRREVTARRSTTHGLRRHPLYSVWLGMKQRCLNEKDKKYMDYGGRGIKVAILWLEDFEAFYDFMIEKGWKKGLEIDRRNNDGDYTPENVRIATRQENMQNTRSTRFDKYKINRIREFLSVGFGVNELARTFKTDHGSISRIRDGLSWSNV